jgi:hypothetical protein
VANALELACSLGFPKILLNMDMAAIATETQNTCNAKQQQRTTSLTGKFEKLICSNPDHRPD